MRPPSIALVLACLVIGLPAQVPSRVTAPDEATLTSPNRRPARAEEVDELRLKSAFGRVRAACAFVEVESEMGGGGFSAVLVDAAGTLFTAGHCVMRGESYTVILPDGRRFAAEPRGAEKRVDAGLIKIIDPPADLPFVALGRSDGLNPGDPVFSVGFPGDPQADRGPVLRFGRVGKTRTEQGFIESSALMEPGDSGGPLFDLDGHLIGIHSQIRESLDQNQDVPIEIFLAYREELERPATFRAPKIAAETYAFELVDTPSGCRVSELEHEGAAFAAGLRLGDVVTKIGGREIDEARRARRGYRRAWRRALRDGLELEVKRAEKSLALRFPSPVVTRIAKLTPGGTVTAVAPTTTLASPVYRIVSEVDGKDRTIRATAVNGAGWLVSKASDVGENIRVTGAGAEALSGEVRFRDSRHDLCLIAVEGLSPASHCRFEGGGDLECGTGVRTALPDADEPHRGVISSRLHRSIGRYLLGIRLKIEDGRILVRSLDRKMPASAAGLTRGDRIKAIDGRPVGALGEIGAYLATFEAPREVRLDIERDEKPMTIRLTPVRAGAPSMGMHVADKIDGGFSDRRSDFPLVFGHDARLRADECGAPLRDQRGRPVGLTIARRSRTQNLALPNVVLRDFLRRARAALAKKN